MKVTPQEKKIRDYSKQRKNAYRGNNSSFVAVRKRKRHINRSYRRLVKNQLVQPIEDIDNSINNIKKHYWWKKSPNVLIIETLDSKMPGSSRYSRVSPHKSRLRNEAEKRIRRSKAKHGL